MGASATVAARRQQAAANDLHSPRCSCYSEPFATDRFAPVYVCNCNGLRKRDVAAAIEAGATRPRDVFARNQCAAQCAKCVCEMREMIQDSRESYAMAAE